MIDAELQHNIDLLRESITVPEGMPFRPGAYDALRIVLRGISTLDKPAQILLAKELAPHGQWLLSYANRAAIESVRFNDPEELRAGFYAVALENGQNDWRDILATLSLLNHSANKLGISADAQMQGVITAASPPTRKVIRSFLKRPPDLRQIERMGYREGTSTEGFSYERLQ